MTDPTITTEPAATEWWVTNANDHAVAQAAELSRLQAESERQRIDLADALRLSHALKMGDLIAAARETWDYAAEFFADRGQIRRERDQLRAALAQAGTGDTAPEDDDWRRSYDEDVPGQLEEIAAQIDSDASLPVRPGSLGRLGLAAAHLRRIAGLLTTQPGSETGEPPNIGDRVTGWSGGTFGIIEGELVTDESINRHGWAAIHRDGETTTYAVLPPTVKHAFRTKPARQESSQDTENDPEQFCDTCFAGTDSPEHHEKCEDTDHA